MVFSAEDNHNEVEHTQVLKGHRTSVDMELKCVSHIQ